LRTWFGRGYGHAAGQSMMMMTRQAYGNTAMCCSTNRFKSIIPPVYIQKVVTTVHVAVHTAGAKLLLTLSFHFNSIISLQFLKLFGL